MPNLLADYPIFAPDFPLPDRREKAWTMRDARRYFDWFMSVKDARIAHARTFLSLTPALESEPAIDELDASILALAPTEFRQGEGMICRAYSLGADIGLIFARLVEQHIGPDRLTWMISPERSKRYVSYRLPELYGFGKMGGLDPVLIGPNFLLRASDSRPSGLITAFHAWTDAVDPA